MSGSTLTTVITITHVSYYDFPPRRGVGIYIINTLVYNYTVYGLPIINYIGSFKYYAIYLWLYTIYL